MTQGDYDGAVQALNETKHENKKLIKEIYDLKQELARLKEENKALKKKLLQHETEISWTCETEVKERERKAAEQMYDLLARRTLGTLVWPTMPQAMQLWESERKRKK